MSERGGMSSGGVQRHRSADSLVRAPVVESQRCLTARTRLSALRSLGNKMYPRTPSKVLLNEKPVPLEPAFYKSHPRTFRDVRSTKD
jgi:hypothetical protein